MKPRVEWTLLWGSFILYLLAGGIIFMYLEYQNDMEQNEDIVNLKRDAQRVLLNLDRDFYGNGTDNTIITAIYSAKEGVINRISQHCGVDFLSDLNEPISNRWTFYDSVIFSFTVITTIGRLLCMVYALIGIPINGLLLAKMGDLFGRKFRKLHKRSKEKDDHKKWTLILEVVFYLVPGFIFFIIVPAGFFVLIENWTFLDSIYFAFITLTTIGFGDFVAGEGAEGNPWYVMYRIMIIVWIIFGLGYVFMILGFITKGLTHKYVAAVISKKLRKLKRRHKKKEKMSKDVEYMRRVVNELYMMKIRPVYSELLDPDEKTHNTNQLDFMRKPSWKDTVLFHSHPNICHRTKYEKDPDFYNNNKYCNDTYCCRPPKNYDGENGGKTRRFSDTILLQIDREKTFEAAKARGIDKTEFLLKMAEILNNGSLLEDVCDVAQDIGNESDGYIGDLSLSEEETDIINENPWDDENEDSDESAVDYGFDDEKIPEETEEELNFVDDEDRCLTNLEQVIVHPKDPASSYIPSTSILEKVNVVLRKISASSKASNSEGTTTKSTPAERRSRKISRNSSRSNSRKTSRNQSRERERKISKDKFGGSHGHFPQIVPIVDEELKRKSRKISEESMNLSLKSFKSTSTKVLFTNKDDEVHHWFNENRRRSKSQDSYSDRRFGWDRRGSTFSSKDDQLSSSDEDDIPRNNFHPRAEHSTSTANNKGKSQFFNDIENTTLDDFLKALDAVHDKLKPQPCTSKEQTKANINSQDQNQDQIILDQSLTDDEQNTSRRRKVGVFHDGFSYVNQAFKK